MPSNIASYEDGYNKKEEPLKSGPPKNKQEEPLVTGSSVNQHKHIIKFMF